jgi:hypothetical protein
MITALENTSSTTQKKQILTEFLQERDVADLVRYTYDPFKKFHVSSKNVKKLEKTVKPKNSYAMNTEGFMQMLDDMSSGTLSGHNAASEILGWVHDLPDQFDSDIIYRIIDKDLKCRVNASLINKAHKGLIDEFKVALAETYKPERDEIGEDWFVSRKLDGCLHGDTIVEFEDGTIETIKNVVSKRIDKNIKSYNHKTKEIEYKPILGWYKNVDDIKESDYEWFEIETDNGGVVRLTGNHRIWIDNLGCYRRVDQLNGDEVVLMGL